MPNLSWVHEDTDLDFLRTDEYPATLSHLIRKDGTKWVELFTQWYQYNLPGQVENLERWRTFAAKFKSTGKRQQSEVEAGIQPELTALWADLFKNLFTPDCREIREWLEEIHTAEGAQTDKGWFRSKAKTAEAAAARREKVRKAILKSHSEEQEMRHGTSVRSLDATVTRLQGLLTAVTAELVPQLNEIQATFGAVAQSSEFSTQRLTIAHEGFQSSSAQLRDVCLQTMSQEEQDRSSEAVIAAWSDYTTQYQKVVNEAATVAVRFLKWAKKDTADKIQENFESAHPEVAAAQVAVRGLVTAIGVTAGIIGTATGVGLPVATTATSVAQKLLSAIEKLTRGAVAKAEAEDPNVLREHVGRNYDGSSVLDDEVLDQVEDGFDTALETAGAFIEEIPGVGPVIISVMKLADRKILKDTNKRSVLLKALESALEGTAPTTDRIRVSIVSIDSASDTIQIEINGRSGTMIDGRFSPDDRSGSFKIAVDSWRRSTRNVWPSFPNKQGLMFAGQMVPSFGITNDGMLTSWESVADAVSFSEGDGGFRCSAHAHGFGLNSELRIHDDWLIFFTLSHEGEVKLEHAECQTASFEVDGDPVLAITAYDPDDIEMLFKLKEEDSHLENIRLTQVSYRPDFPGGQFTVDRGTLVDDDNTVVTTLTDMAALTHGILEDVKTSLQNLQDGHAEIVDWEHPYVRQMLGEFEAPLKAYWNLKLAEDQGHLTDRELNVWRYTTYDALRSDPAFRDLAHFVSRDADLTHHIAEGQLASTS